MASRQLPARAEVVIIGGGAMGTSTAFHLAEAGVPDVVLLEQAALGSGSTSKAAGGVRAQFSDELNIELGRRSVEAFERFGQRPGHQIDLHQDGYLFLLSTPESLAAFEQAVALQNSLGVPSRMISPEEAKTLSPIIETDGLLAAAFSARDGHCTPEAVVLGYAGAARRLGARLFPGVEATGIDVRGDRIVAVQTAAGRIETGTVVCAAGAWSARVGQWVGLDLPVTPLRRQIVVTEPIEDLPPGMPMTLDLDTTFYFHTEGRGLLIGMSDPQETPGFKLTTSQEWLPRLHDAIAGRAPRLLDVGMASGWAGLYEVTPDHNALVGEGPGVGRFLYATGFSGHGLLQSPAIGEVLRDLYLGHPPYLDLSPLDASRFATRADRPELYII